MTDSSSTKPAVAVDTEFLAKCLGLDSWPEYTFPGAEPGPAYLGNWRSQYAARVITDAFRPYSISGKVIAETAIRNAEGWITDAYNKGRMEGIQQERNRWQSRIKEMFGL